jgi:hypothetical protein
MILTKTFAQLDGVLVYNLAKSPNTCPSILKELSEDSRESVRNGVAKNPNTPMDILTRLSKDSNGLVRLGVVENPRVPRNLLLGLSDDVSSVVEFLADCRLKGEVI